MKIKSRIQLVLWAVLFVVAMSFSAYAADGQIKIGQTASTTFPIVIDQPGSYVLTSNLVVSIANVIGIVIAADNVTLDLNGHALIGPGSGSGNGIESNKNNIAVMNGTVRGFGGNGIILQLNWIYGKNNQVENVKSCSNGGAGITVLSSTVTNCTANSNGGGILAIASSITDCTVNDNGTNGINTSMSVVTNCTSNSNGFYGIRVAKSTITNCTANSNGSDGIRANWHEFGTSSVTITNCTVNSNSGHGILAHHNCRIEGNNLRGNGGWGLYLQASHNYAIKNAASDNASGNFVAVVDNYMPISLIGPDAANANIGW